MKGGAWQGSDTVGIQKVGGVCSFSQEDELACAVRDAYKGEGLMEEGATQPMEQRRLCDEGFCF